MTAPEVGAHRTQLDAAVGALALQVNRETVLQARAALLAEADRLDKDLQRIAPRLSAASAYVAATPSRPRPPRLSTSALTHSSTNCLTYNRDLRASAQCSRCYCPGLWLHRRRDRGVIPADLMTTIRLRLSPSWLLLCAACSSAVSGYADTADHQLPKLPPRPREIRIDGMDPCKTLTLGTSSKSLGVRFYSTDRPAYRKALDPAATGTTHRTSRSRPTPSTSTPTAGWSWRSASRSSQVIAVAGFGAVADTRPLQLGRARVHH